MTTLTWMLRVINVPLALEMRPYPPVDAELHLDVGDDLLADNQDRFILQVSGGKGEVKRGGRGDLHLPIRSLSPLFTGFFSASQLARMGQLEGTEAAIATAQFLFHCDRPSLADIF
ncbi:sterol carrier protein domain-containing protein [Spirulina sp. CS-785/01]|uniref:sterol carrier protein domain-containing protein n=1 Tax=Spirulina sp. CS-785/01 TaxID=3021716 RepID=UPI00232EA9ED|nr:sterol carrier protein domain-containing protein [Spirulina sp. CS-785/01]MDB9313679.1 sterol carrier protein domain-containing protein [Spirulina sp. CS-785/01]